MRLVLIMSLEDARGFYKKGEKRTNSWTHEASKTREIITK